MPNVSVAALVHACAVSIVTILYTSLLSEDGINVYIPISLAALLFMCTVLYNTKNKYATILHRVCLLASYIISVTGYATSDLSQNASRRFVIGSSIALALCSPEP